MCVLKCFSRFIVSFYVKDSVFLESFSFINTASRNVISLSETSAVNLLLDENCLLVQGMNLFLVCRCPIERKRHR